MAISLSIKFIHYLERLTASKLTRLNESRENSGCGVYSEKNVSASSEFGMRFFEKLVLDVGVRVFHFFFLDLLLREGNNLIVPIYCTGFSIKNGFVFTFCVR